MRHRCNKSDRLPLMTIGLVLLTLACQPSQGDATENPESQGASPPVVQERGVPILPPSRVPTGSPCPMKLGALSDRISGGPELCVSGLTLSQTRHVAFTVQNIGSRTTGAPLLVDVYLNNAKTDSIQMSALGSHTAQSVETAHAVLSTCQPALVRVVIDPLHVVAEEDRTNNDNTVNWPLPCPDVTAEISQHKVNADLQYKAHVKVINHGGLPMPAVQVRTLGVTYSLTSATPPPSQCIQNHNCDVQDGRTVEPLAPGQVVEYDVDPKFRVDQTLVVEVAILCSPPNNCLESNQANNTVRKVIGPH
jgi:hypothetical protein